MVCEMEHAVIFFSEQKQKDSNVAFKVMHKTCRFKTQSCSVDLIVVVEASKLLTYSTDLNQRCHARRMSPCLKEHQKSASSFISKKKVSFPLAKLTTSNPDLRVQTHLHFVSLFYKGYLCLGKQHCDSLSCWLHSSNSLTHANRLSGTERGSRNNSTFVCLLRVPTF